MPRPHKKRPPEPLEDADCLAVLERFGPGPCGRRNVALFYALWRTGMRLNECLSLELRDLLSTPPTARVRRGKGGRSRVLGYPPDAWSALQLWIRIRGDQNIKGRLVFPTLKGAKMDQGYVRRTFVEKSRRTTVARRVHPHGLRHTFARNMSKGGARIEVIRDALGHSSIAVTDHYLRGVASTDVVDEMIRHGLESET